MEEAAAVVVTVDSDAMDGMDDAAALAAASLAAKEAAVPPMPGARGGVPKDNQQYKTREYWEERFGREDKYEWLVSFDDVASLLREPLKQCIARGQVPGAGGIGAQAGVAAPAPASAPELAAAPALAPELAASPALAPELAAALAPAVLVVGCGNSDFSADLVSRGEIPAASVTSIDFSQQVIDKMQQKHPELRWLTMDMCAMTAFAAESFDMVIDKAAMDALVTDEGDPWNPNEETLRATSDMMQHVARVLRPGGQFLQITFQQPHFRKRHLASVSEVLGAPSVQDIDKGLGYFFISMTKKSDPSTTPAPAPTP